MPRFLRWLASIGSGLALWACYPPLDAGWLVWVALIPLLSVLWGRTPLKARHGFGYGYVAGLVFFLLNLKWLRHVTECALMIPFYLALYIALWGAFVAAMERPPRNDPFTGVMKVVSIGAAWTGLEWLRGMVFSGFGWNGLGVAMHQSPHLASQAEWIGVTGLSFWVVLFQAALALIAIAMAGPASLKDRVRARAASLLVLVMFGALYGAPTWWLVRADARRSALLAPRMATPLRVALVQPNIAQEVKNVRDEFDSIARGLARLTDQAVASEPPPALIVWPESALPSTIDDPNVADFLDQTVKRGEFALALGIDVQLMDKFYNSVAVLRGEFESTRVHAKVHLVPFGEYLPGRDVLGKLEWIRELLPGDFDAGESTEPLTLPGTDMEMIPLVCFEDTVGRVARMFVRPKPQVIVNVTNDAWFRDSEGAEQHLANAIFRCLELRRPMIRAANTGVTAVINAQGEVTDRLPRLEAGVLTATVAVPEPGISSTFYAQHGDLFPQSMLGLAGAALLWSRLRARRSQKQVAS